ncbi:unnamed protein product [Rhizoctonia solani]|uniref:Laminin domain protein n=1 Tax=Rhizoctonia solani TaxID=456999 RepID=A0A8H3E014_9AGAM|nr:unnamed protein product [Rhizoctonia solani]
MLFRPRDITLIPPQLPAYLSTYNLERIVGKPTDDQVKAIHAAIRALNSVAHLPALYDPDLSMQLSQHLFNAQLRIAVHREECMVALLPSDESTFIPPDLPPHIPGTLHKVIGAPSYDDVKSVQSAIRDVENLAYNSHLFDADLSMKLYQHLFNIQFARYMRDSVHGSFTSRIDSEERHPGVTSQSNNDSQQNNMNTRSEDRHHVTTRSSGPEQVKSSEITQLGDVMKEIKDAIGESKHVLKHMNKVLVATQRSMSTVTVGL